jgi:hypothetical protein
MDQRATILAIADSGSDRTIFNTEVARLLGITIQRGTMETFSGTSGHKQAVYYHPLEVEIRSGSLAISYEAEIGFALLPRDIAGLLGQVGFFDHFEVTLNQQKGLVILKHRT